MRITSLRIRNFKSIGSMYIEAVEDALILVGQNNTGKTAVLDAIRAVGGSYDIQPEDFREDASNIEVFVTLQFGEEDLQRLQKNGIVSQYRRMEPWKKDYSIERFIYFESRRKGEGEYENHSRCGCLPGGGNC